MVIFSSASNDPFSRDEKVDGRCKEVMCLSPNICVIFPPVTPSGITISPERFSGIYTTE